MHRVVHLWAGVLLWAGAGACAWAQPPACLPLTPSGTQGGALLPGGLMNVRASGTTAAPLALDVYPHTDAATRPLALVLRGGRGTVGQRSSYVGQLVEAFGEAGYVVATADYRSDGAEVADADVTAALRLLTMCHAEALHVDPYRTVLVAEDSAAGTAVRVASRLRDLRLGRFGGAPSPPAMVVVVGGRVGDVPASSVPTLVVHGTADTEEPLDAVRTWCARSTATCAVIEVPGASHRAENWWPSQWGYKATMLRRVGEAVGPVPAARREATSGPGLHKRVTFDAARGLTLDAWIPDGTGPHGAIVIVHGGGWEAGDRVTYVPPLFALAASRGLAWISIDYRLTPDVSNREQVADVRAALTWLRTQAGAWRIDPGRLVLVGESASGQLVTLVAGAEPSLAGVVSFYGVYDLEAMAGDPAQPRSLARRLFGITALDTAARTTLRAHSPQHQVSASLPPLLLIAGTADRLVDQQRAYAAALVAAGARVETIELPDAPHGLEAWHDDPRWRSWADRVGAWCAARVHRP